MAKLILEIQKRGLHQYQRLEQFPVTIGRALDNDVILSDVSVSPHHLRIEQDEAGELYLHNLSKENGTRMNGALLGELPARLPVPSRLLLGSRRLNLLTSDTPVTPTNMLKFGSFYSIMANPVWVGVLLVLAVVGLFSENYLHTFMEQGVWYYLSDILLNLVVMAVIALFIAGVNWLVSHRWVFSSALGIVALLTLLKSLLGVVGDGLDYFFTSDTPQNVLLTLYNIPLVTLLLYFFQRWASYLRPWSALGIAILLSLPLVILEVVGLGDEASFGEGFSPNPVYNQTLSSFNIHAAPTLPLNEFLQQVEEALPNSVEK